MKRRTWSPKQRLALFAKYGGRCHLCSLPIGPGQAWEVSHETPLAMGGADDDVNAKPAHVRCHAAITPEDQADIAKAKRREAKHVGAVGPKKEIKGPAFRPSSRRERHPIPMPPRRSIYGSRGA